MIKHNRCLNGHFTPSVNTNYLLMNRNGNILMGKLIE